MPSNESVLTGLRWKKFPVLDDGFVCLVDCMGDDAAIVQAARVSYGEGTKAVSDNRTLIRYLMRMRHSTPFEMAELKFLVRVPMDHWRQWIRHRTANVNEYSTRYSEAIDSAAQTAPDKWRRQSGTNKQGSGGFVEDWPGEIAAVADLDGSPGKHLSDREDALHRIAREVYEERLEFGVAREQARKDLPLSTYTQAYWKIDLHNLLHFLSLRMDSHAQSEIRDYATIIGEQIVAPLFPLVWEAFRDYRLESMQLTRLDQVVIWRLAQSGRPAPYSEEQFKTAQHDDWVNLDRCRERDECREKLVSMGLLKEQTA